MKILQNRARAGKGERKRLVAVFHARWKETEMARARRRGGLRATLCDRIGYQDVWGDLPRKSTFLLRRSIMGEINLACESGVSIVIIGASGLVAAGQARFWGNIRLGM